MTIRATTLITNDDGIESPGLHRLALEAVESGLEVIVAAPATESSGSGAAILGTGTDGLIHMERRELPGLEGVPAFAVQAAPGLIALIAAHGAFDAVPDLVLSGVNRGANIGRAILHSGTVGAALTGAMNGARALAVSLDVGLDPSAFHWGSGARLAAAVIPRLLELEPGTALNLNVPNEGGGTLPELRAARLAPFGIVQTTMAERGEGTVRLAVADLPEHPDPESDAALLAAGFATLTHVTAIGELPLPEAVLA